VKNELEHIRQEAIQKISAAKTPEVLRDIEIEYLGRKQGKLALLLREVPKLPDDERPEMGKFGNIIKNEITDALAQKMVECEEQEETGGFFDYSAPSKKL
jgi:phenylalanyl-tRNA synthetase alpha chain